MRKKNQKGFTLIELVVVMVIIAILAVIAVPMYRNYTLRAMASEARTLVGSIASAEKVWIAEHTTYTDVLTDLGIDVTQNMYFDAASVAINVAGDAPSGTASFQVTITGATSGAPRNADVSGIVLDYNQQWGVAPVITETIQ